MKKRVFAAMGLLAVALFGCRSEPSFSTEATAVNESSYDLRIIFAEVPPYSGFSGIIDVNQGGSVLFFSFVPRAGGKERHYNPNYDVVNIVIYTLVAGETGELIKEMNTKDNFSVFEFMGYNKNTALYQFKITDELLQN